MAEPSFRRSHIHKGFDYHQMFVSCPHRAMIWSLVDCNVHSCTDVS